MNSLFKPQYAGPLARFGVIVDEKESEVVIQIPPKNRAITMTTAALLYLGVVGPLCAIAWHISDSLANRIAVLVYFLIGAIGVIYGVWWKTKQQREENYHTEFRVTRTMLKATAADFSDN